MVVDLVILVADHLLSGVRSSGAARDSTLVLCSGLLRFQHWIWFLATRMVSDVE